MVEEKSVFIAENVSYALVAIIAIFIILIIILFIFMFFIPTSKTTKMKPGGNCTVGSDCTTGLCEVGVCVIPLAGNCTDYVNNCKSGSTCINNVCSTQEVKRLQAKTYLSSKNNQPQLKGTVISPDYYGSQNPSSSYGSYSSQNPSSSYGSYSSQNPSSSYGSYGSQITPEKEVCDNTMLYVSSMPDMSDYSVIYDKPYVDAFSNNDLIYIADSNGIKVFDRDNQYRGNLRSNIPITGTIEVSQNKVYMLDKDGKLYMSSLPPIGGQLNFIYQNRNAYDIIRSEDGNNIYLRDKETDPHVMIGGKNDRIEVNDRQVKYINENGKINTFDHNGNYPILYQGKIYLQPSRTKVYKDLFLTTA
jgi:hypothetical protein